MGDTPGDWALERSGKRTTHLGRPGLESHRRRKYKLSRDKQFGEKLTEAVGL